MTVPGAYFRKAVIEEHPYPVKAAFMQCCNPLLAYADSRQTFDALAKLDFFSVTDIFMTPTAAMADIVLPAASHFEFNDLGHYGLGHGFILARPKVVNPPNECWPDIKILNELGKVLTPGPHWHEDFQDLMAEVLAPSGLTYDQFAEKGYLKGPDNFQKYRAAGFKTPSGKVELRLSQAEKFHVAALPRALDGPQAEGLKENPDYPLILTSSKDAFYLHSSYRWVARLRKQSPEPVVEIHPETAARYRIADGDAVMIETPMGAITQTARLNASLRPEVVHAAYGWWFPEAAAERQFDWTGSNFNMLTSTATLGREFGTPNLKGLRCRVYPKQKPGGI
jgi:anaerobic selenocysteine-containing dehydrogenase